MSPGAFQTSFAGWGGGWGAFDIGIIKLSPNGSNRMYATYLGGSGNEMPQSIICDQQGNLIVAGRSNSSNYPVKPANNLKGTGGGFDIIVTKINAAGDGLVGSMRIGGTQSDGGNIDDYPNGAGSLLRNYGDEARSEVNIDDAGNIYLASCTQSGDFPIVSGFQGTKAGGQDGVVLKLSPDVSNLLFSTYWGGSGHYAAYVLATNPLNGNIYVAGGTESSNFPGDHTRRHRSGCIWRSRWFCCTVLGYYARSFHISWHRWYRPNLWPGLRQKRISLCNRANNGFMATCQCRFF